MRIKNKAVLCFARCGMVDLSEKKLIIDDNWKFENLEGSAVW